MINDHCIICRYIYSACIVTSTPDTRVLHDPWFSEGIYDGSWYHFPEVKDPLHLIGDVDLIYISHIHPDHYDPTFLKNYFNLYGTKKILIANHNPNYLVGKMRADGIVATVLDNEFVVGDTQISIIPHKTGSISDVDSAIIIKYQTADKTHCLVNANDIIFDPEMRKLLKDHSGEVDILLCGYTGAGPYPQTYFDVNDPVLIIKAEEKKQAFFERYKTLINEMEAKVNIPFAGKYILGGNRSHLNNFRGVADAVEVLAFDKNAVVLADGGGEINTSDLTPKSNQIRTALYPREVIDQRINEISSAKMNYEKLFALDETHQLPIKRLLMNAARNAISKSECEDNYYFCIKLPTGEVALINANKHLEPNLSFKPFNSALPTPRSEIEMDPRYLFGLLTNIYHWNNGEIGSHYYVRRTPDIFNRKAQAFLNFLTL